jgi:hypothetical protein
LEGRAITGSSYFFQGRGDPACFCLEGHLSVSLEGRAMDEIGGVFVPLIVGFDCHAIKKCGIHCQRNKTETASFPLCCCLACRVLPFQPLCTLPPNTPTCSDARPNLLCYSNAHLDSLLSGLTHGSSSSSFHIVMHGSSSSHRHLGTLALHLHPSAARAASPVAPLNARASPRVALLLTTRRFGHCNRQFASS